ncbi:hypothetical protein F4776DRAFT_218659 [Hypoxylon sp. NC0597]|nr:hypothetical protein F4776DRAFT_218659 [Hypoxylon sp. NC0597]
MYPTTLKIDIGQNKAADNSNQKNKVVNKIYQNTFVLWTPRLGELYGYLVEPFLSQRQNQEPNLSTQEVRDYLLSLMGETQVRMVREKPASCQCDGRCLPNLNLFKYEVEKYTKELKDRPSVLKALSDKNFGTITQWIGETGPQVLVVAGGQGNGKWTTNLALEIMGLKYLEPSHQAVAFTAHLCGINFKEKQGQEVFLIQDLLGQLVEAYQDTSDDIRMCPQTESSTQEPKAIGVEVKKLWDLFSQCIKKARIRKLIIVIDRIDYIYAKCTLDETFSEFVKSLDTFCKSLWNDGITVKMMVISGHPKVAGYFEDIKALRTIKLQAPPC